MRLHTFNETCIDKDCSSLEGEHSNGLFYNCVFDNLKGLTLKSCILNGSKFITQKVHKALGFTLTLSCGSFRNVEYSEMLFDLLLCLMTMTKGNDEKRAELIRVVGHKRHEAYMRVLGGLE